MALSRIDTTNMIEDVPQSKLDNNINFRNIIINGDMSIAQRGTSVSSLTNSGYRTCDRWRITLTSFGTWTASQDTDVPTGQGFAKSLKMDCTTANGSLSSNSIGIIEQRFEGQNLQYLKKGTSSAVSTTVSFWVKSTKTGTFICELDDNDNTRNINKSYTISSSDTWEKKTITFDGDTTGALGNDNGYSFRLLWWLGAGTDLSSGTLQTSWGSTVNANRAVGQANIADSTSNNFYITGVQWEAGTTASDFEFLPVDVNLQRCQRYFQSIGGVNDASIASGMTQNSSGSTFTIHYITTMRSAPTHAVNDLNITDNVSYGLSVSSVNALFANNNSSRCNLTHSSGATQYRPCFLRSSSTASTSRLTLEAEL